MYWHWHHQPPRAPTPSYRDRHAGSDEPALAFAGKPVDGPPLLCFPSFGFGNSPFFFFYLFLRVPSVSSCRLSPLVFIGIGVPVEVRVALLWIIANGERRWRSHRLFASPVLVLRRRSVLPLETDASRRRPNAHSRCSATRGSAIPNRNPHCYESLQLVVRHAMPRRAVPYGLDTSLGLSTRVR